MSDPLKPSLSLLCKLGSIAGHAAELFSRDGHAFDRDALESVLDDAELKEWLNQMDKLALIPKRRDP